MRATIDLAGLVNAEIISRDGVPGVFIPIEPNCTIKYGSRGRRVFASFRLWPASVKKNYDFRGIQTIPNEYADKYLSNPIYAGKRDRIAWAWSEDANRDGGGLVSEADFERIVGGM